MIGRVNGTRCLREEHQRVASAACAITRGRVSVGIGMDEDS